MPCAAGTPGSGGHDDGWKSEESIIDGRGYDLVTAGSDDGPWVKWKDEPTGKVINFM